MSANPLGTRDVVARTECSVCADPTDAAPAAEPDAFRGFGDMMGAQRWGGVQSSVAVQPTRRVIGSTDLRLGPRGVGADPVALAARAEDSFASR